MGCFGCLCIFIYIYTNKMCILRIYLHVFKGNLFFFFCAGGGSFCACRRGRGQSVLISDTPNIWNV